MLLYEPGQYSGNTLVISPLDNFKSVVHTTRESDGARETGVGSEIESLPPGFVHRTLLTYGSNGITGAMDAWGG